MASATASLEGDIVDENSALAEAEAVRAFIGEVEGFCKRMLSFLMAQKVGTAAHRSLGSDTIRRQEDNVLKALEEKAASKKDKTSASANMLKERFEKRQIRVTSFPEDASKAKKLMADGSKKTKKKNFQS